MAVIFVVSDGTGLPNATSYSSVEDLKQYWENLGYSLNDSSGTPITDEQFQVWLNRSTKYLDDNYRSRYPGIRQTTTQKLEWPRKEAYYSDGAEIPESTIPQEIKDAAAEASNLIREGSNLSAVISRSGKIESQTTTVDVIQESIKYETGSTLYQDIQTPIEDALSRLFGGISGFFNLKIVRNGGDSP